jgi:uracil-DNA glycosylase
MIRGHGNSKPKAFFIADGPSNEDLRNEYALTGASASTLQGFCKGEHLNLEDFWRTCLIKESLPREDDKQGTETKRLIEQYAPILIDEINTLEPNLLIPLGEVSFNYLTSLNSIRKFRGSVLPLNGSFQINKPNTKVLPILGPDPYLNKEYRLRFITRVDFSKIHKNIEDGPIPDNFYNIWVARTSTALRAFFDRNYQRTLDAGGFLTFDIETYLQIPICISFCFDGMESVTVPLVDKSIDFDHRVLMMDLVARLLASPIRKVNQNIKYDWRIMERWGFIVNNVCGDTMLAASTIYCEFPKNLGFLTSIYTDLPYFKDEGKQFDPDRTKRDRYYLYNAKDSLATSQIYSKQESEIAELGTAGVYNNLIAVMPCYKRMEDRGIRIDEETRDKLLIKYEIRFHIEELKLKKLLNRDYFNPLSPVQCREAIYDELGYTKIRGIKTTEKGEPSTDEESLDILRANGHAKRAPSTGPIILDCIIAARKFHKVIEILELHLHPDKRFRCEFNLAGTENGRSSAGETTDQLIIFEKGKPKTINLGHSLQTIGKHGFMVDGITYGKDLRRMFVPSPNCSFVEIDLSGAEARVDRVLSGVFDMSVFDNPGIHKLTGSWVYGCEPHEIKKNVLDEEGIDRYHMAKTIRHAGERNMGAERLMIMTQRPEDECNRLLATFHKFQPEIRGVFHKQIKAALDSPGPTLICPNGRRRDFFDRISNKTYNEGISFIPQAIVSDQVKFNGILPTFNDKSVSGHAFLLSEMHDGILAEVHKGKELEFARCYKVNVEVPIDFRRCTLSRDYELMIPAEVSIGENWLDLEEVKDV